jgi:hypothetical protein
MVKLNTQPTVCLHTVRHGLNGKRYWKAVMFYRGKSWHLCYVPTIDAERLISGRLNPIEYFKSKCGIRLEPKTRSCESQRVRVNAVFKPAADVSGYEVVADVYVMRRGGKFYAYIKPLYAKHQDLHFPLPNRIQYLGKLEQLIFSKLLPKEEELKRLLAKKGYLLEDFYVPLDKKRGKRKKPREEGREWIMNKMEQGDLESIRERYESVGEFLETFSDDEEMARDIYGSEEVDEFYEE